MTWRTIAALACTLVVSLSACSDAVSSPSLDDAERAQLVQRTIDLKASVVAAGRVTLEHRTAILDLERRIRAWQARTGRSDLAIAAKPAKRTDVSAAIVTGPSDTCSPCPSTTFRDGYICFLEWKTPCNPKDIVSQGCGYLCVFVGSPPIRRA